MQTSVSLHHLRQASTTTTMTATQITNTSSHPNSMCFTVLGCDGAPLRVVDEEDDAEPPAARFGGERAGEPRNDNHVREGARRLV